jgi:cyanophycin synthase-like protein
MRVVEILFYDANKVKLVVEMPDPDRCTTDNAPHLPRSLFRLFPHLAHHKCHNGNGYSFKREAQATEVPHLFEHLIIELQSQAQHHEVLKGETQWNWRVDPRGTFHVHVEYENPLLVLAAIRLAERIVNLVDRDQIEVIDLSSEMDRLKRIAEYGRDLGVPNTESKPRPLFVGSPMAGVKGGRARAQRPSSRSRR